MVIWRSKNKMIPVEEAAAKEAILECLVLSWRRGLSWIEWDSLLEAVEEITPCPARTYGVRFPAGPCF